MPYLGGASPIFTLFAASVSSSLRRSPSSLPRSLSFSFPSFIPTPTLRRAFSIMAHPRNDLFDYTSGRWIFNETLRHAERRRVFNVDELCRLAAKSVDRSPDDIVDFAKLAEGGFNRTFLITMHDGFQMVARIPYPLTLPKYYAVASEVATMDLLRSSGLPIPKVFGYSPVSDNAAETEYMFMEYVRGTALKSVWYDLDERELISVLRQLVELEAKMMSISFPAGGSLYYAQDLEKVTGGPGIPLEDERYCVGPDTRLPMWSGRRSQLDVDRGPYETAEAALVSAAHKELAYLEQFGRPLLPFQRVRRHLYRFQEQSPSDHIENLNRYLSIAPSLVPKDPTLNHFHIRHPDLYHTNVVVMRSPHSDWRVVGLIDWQHASILPSFLLAGIPERLQNYNDPVSDSMTRPSLPENLNDLNEIEQENAKYLHHRRLVHYHYVKNTKDYNELHHAALEAPMSMLRRRLFSNASAPWEGETLALKVALIDATASWDRLTGEGTPCPIRFDTEDVRETQKLDDLLTEADKSQERGQNIVGVPADGWVPTDNYEATMMRNKQLKEDLLTLADSAEEVAEIETHWVFGDMDEGIYT